MGFGIQKTKDEHAGDVSSMMDASAVEVRQAPVIVTEDDIDYPHGLKLGFIMGSAYVCTFLVALVSLLFH